MTPDRSMPGTSVTHEAVTAVWRHESVRLIAGLARMTHDLDLAEDLAQDALVAALESWPAAGVPTSPGAWLMTVAKRRAVDQFRRNDTLRRKVAELGHTLTEEDDMPDLSAEVDHVEDDVLRLMFLSCHPALPPESRTVLTLRLVGGLTTEEIARACFAKPATIGQRISRAKKSLEGVSFEPPTGEERRARLREVMQTIYLVFNEGYAASAGEHWTRPELCLEGLRLARILAGLVPEEPEVHGLQALLELQGSRLHARHDAAGTPVLLEDQDRRHWDQLLIRRGQAALDRAYALDKPVGTYVLQAALAACHALARTAAQTDWREIARLYDVLAGAAPGPVVEVNRALAHGRAFGSETGLRLLEGIDLPGPQVPAVRGDLLLHAGRLAEAAVAFREAAKRTENADERRILLGRAATTERRL